MKTNKFLSYQGQVRLHHFQTEYLLVMMIAHNSRVRKRGKERGEVKGKYGRIRGEEEGNADYGGMVQPRQQHFAPCVKVVEWGFG